MNKKNDNVNGEADRQEKEATLTRCREAYDEMVVRGRDFERWLQYLSGNGLNIFHSIRLLREVDGYELFDAKRLVHYSDTWEDARRPSKRLDAYMNEFLSKVRPPGSRPESE